MPRTRTGRKCVFYTPAYEPTGKGILKNISVKPENNEESAEPQEAPPDKEMFIKNV
jgi:hypothetical protein